MRTPKPYLSQSQIYLWENNPEEYKERYFRGKKFESTVYMDLGKEVALALEKGESEDEIISLLITTFPAYPLREEPLRVTLKDGKEEIHLLAILDGIDFDQEILGDYKTGKKWTKKQAQESRQLRFYHLCYFLKTGKMLKKLFIHWAETAWIEDELRLTGNVQTFEVTHNRLDLLKEQMAVKKAYKEISAAYAKELTTIN